MTWPLSGIVVFAACVVLVMLLAVRLLYLKHVSDRPE